MEKKVTVLDAYNDFLKALCGYDLSFYQSVGDIVKIEDGKLCFYQDVSHHGSPDYKMARIQELTPNQAEILETMLAMKKKVEQVNAEKELAELEKQKTSIEKQMECIFKSGKLNYTEK